MPDVRGNDRLLGNHQFGKHGLYAEAGLIYRDTKDYIKRGLDVLGGTSYGYYESWDCFPYSGKRWILVVENME